MSFHYLLQHTEFCRSDSFGTNSEECLLRHNIEVSWSRYCGQAYQTLWINPYILLMVISYCLYLLRFYLLVRSPRVRCCDSFENRIGHCREGDFSGNKEDIVSPCAVCPSIRLCALPPVGRSVAHLLPLYSRQYLTDSVWISNYIPVVGWNILSIPWLQHSALEIWEWISDFILLFDGHVITYP